MRYLGQRSIAKAISTWLLSDRLYQLVKTFDFRDEPFRAQAKFEMAARKRATLAMFAAELAA
jgi:hypothetical protein